MSRKHKQLLWKQLAKLLVFSMILSLIVPMNITAQQAMNQNKKVKVEDKLDSNLVQAFEDEESIRYLVILNEQTDTEKVALHAKESANKKSVSQVKTKEMIQTAIVSELQDNAKTTQKNIKSYLKKDKQNIKTYQSFYIINGLAVTGTKKSAEEIARLPEVKSVILDEKQKLLPVEENKSEPTTEEIEWNIDRVGAPDVWDTGVTGEDTVVANIDSGVEENHPALNRQYRGYNAEDPDNASHEFNWHDAVSGRESPMDSDGHGTHTMGTMVGQEANGENQIGVAPGAKWIAARAFFNDEGYDSYILEAAEWVLAPTDENGIPHPEKAPDVVNNSWGGSPINNDWFLPMVQAWRDAGIVPVFSVGNTGLFEDAEPGSASAPGNYKEVIAVGATDEEDELADFSLRGPSEHGDIKPDISAPGVNIRSAWPGETWDEFEYEQSNGTSMAAPHVAATVLLMKQVDDSLTVEQVESVLKLTAKEKTDEAYPDYPNNGYGYGSLDVKAAVEAVQQGIGTIDGQVTATGEDEAAPTYEHDAREVIFKERDESFSVKAMDDVSVDKVTLTMLLDDGTEKNYTSERVSGDHLDGTYEAVVPKEDVTGESLTYWWTIEDFSGKQTQTDVYDVRIEAGVKAGYMEDFEGYPDGWYSYGTNNSWEWGIPEFGPDQAASGEKVMGTDLRGPYEMDSDMTLVMPPVLVEDHTTLRFNNWYKLSSTGQDTGTVFVSLDEENWEPLYQIKQSNERWHEVGLDLSEYAGEKVFIAFNLETVNENDGWYIDDVQLVDQDATSTQAKALLDKEVSLVGPVKQEKTYPLLTEGEPKAESKAATLPVEAKVKVEETGWETETDPQNGKFAIHHQPGEYTLKINAYGFEPTTETVKLSEKGTVSPEINLEALQSQKISGKIENTSGEEIRDATIFILEDEQSKPVKSNENGTYELDAYEGTYTVKVFAKGYYGKTETITVDSDEDVSMDVTLDSFNQLDSAEIKYDNGSYGKNLAFGKKGNGFAVKMSLDEKESVAAITGAKLQFWADHVPVPGGEDILISVYDAKGQDGAPGNKLAGPIEAKAKRDLNSWTEVDLSDLGIVVDDDFYIAYLQADDYPYIPGFVSDGDEANSAGRSWDYIGGQWFEANEDVGNYMIRADVDYGEASELVDPVIISPKTGEITNEQHISVDGTASPETTIQLMNNGEEVGTEEVNADGEFTVPTVLVEGDNELTVVSIVDDEQERESDPVTVTLDIASPVVTIDSPKDGDVIKGKTVLVEGTADDDHLEKVEVNGQETSMEEDGTYAKEVSLDAGKQEIEVIAYDLAGNTTVESVTIQVDVGGDEPIIENVTPTDDVYLETGESVKITFDSESGLRPTFMIQLPLTNLTGRITSVTELPMMETSAGHYVGYWTATKNTQAEGAAIEVKVADDSGNTVRERAAGKLFINVVE